MVLSICFVQMKNAKRLQKSCARLLMPQVPVETFVSACQEVVKANLAYLPPYGTGGTLYLRPYMIGVGDNIGVAPAKEYIFFYFFACRLVRILKKWFSTHQLYRF